MSDEEKPVEPQSAPNDTPLEFWTFEDIWNEVKRRYPAALLLVMVDPGTPDEMMRTARHGGMYQTIGMLDAARVMAISELGPVISDVFELGDDDDDLLIDGDDDE